MLVILVAWYDSCQASHLVGPIGTVQIQAGSVSSAVHTLIEPRGVPIPVNRRLHHRSQRLTERVEPTRLRSVATHARWASIFHNPIAVVSHHTHPNSAARSRGNLWPQFPLPLSQISDSSSAMNGQKPSSLARSALPQSIHKYFVITTHTFLKALTMFRAQSR